MKEFVVVLTKNIKADCMADAMHKLVNEPLTHCKMVAVLDEPEGGEDAVRGFVADCLFPEAMQD
jgi:hypothetical protein